MLDLLGAGTVVSIDIDRSAFQATHPRIIALTGDSGSPEILAKAKEIAAGKRTMILHDGDHKREAVFRDLVNYSPLVTSGQYFIVEDGVVDIFDPDHSRLGKRWEGPVPAIRQFLASHPEFKIDYNRERYDITYNPYGYLLRT
jgi:cephalosporin hydroxylase